MTDGITRAERGRIPVPFTLTQLIRGECTKEEYLQGMKDAGFCCPECGELYSSRAFIGRFLFCKNGHQWENENIGYSADG